MKRSGLTRKSPLQRASVPVAKKPKPKAPHVTTAGKAATEPVHDWMGMSPEEQAEVMAAKIRANAGL